MSKLEKLQRRNKMRAAWATTDAVADEWRAASKAINKGFPVNGVGVIMDKWEAGDNLTEALWHIQKALEELEKFRPPDEDDYNYQIDEDDE
jgi:hypothetical protein